MMKTIEPMIELNENEQSEIAERIRDYNQYLEDRVKTIMEFDVWYEHSTGKDFPKEWYSVIRQSNKS